jgi:hypothetical protein
MHDMSPPFFQAPQLVQQVGLAPIRIFGVMPGHQILKEKLALATSH